MLEGVERKAKLVAEFFVHHHLCGIKVISVIWYPLQVSASMVG